MKRLELYRCPVCQEMFEVETRSEIETKVDANDYRIKMIVTTNMQLFFMHIRDNHAEKWRQVVREAEQIKARNAVIEQFVIPGLGKFSVPNDPMADAVLQYQENI